MGAIHIQPKLKKIRKHPNFLRFGKLDNVLGVVHEATYKHIRERNSKSPQDLITYISFDDRAHVKAEYVPVHRSERLFREIMSVVPKFGTRFDQALEAAHASLQKVRTMLNMDCPAGAQFLW
jgi:hypothetical protein